MKRETGGARGGGGAPRASAVGAGLLLLIALGGPPALAFPDGAPWETPQQPADCTRCHFDAPAEGDSPALQLLGLPDRASPGARHRLTVRLAAAGLGGAGFLLVASQEGQPAGRFEARDDRTAVHGAQARSTAEGAPLARPDWAEWVVVWTAPEQPVGEILFSLWANAANGDRSPFGDAIHRRSWRLGSALGGGAPRDPE